MNIRIKFPKFEKFDGEFTREKYLDFLERWYEEHSDKLSEQELNTFRSKISSVKCEWPYKVSHVILIGMKRQSRPDKRLPEWEEICAVAMSVQARISFCSFQNLDITLKSTVNSNS